VTQRSGHLYDF